MIAAVKGWHAAWTALVFLLPAGASAADDLNGAARELARKTVAFSGRGEPVSVAWRNVSSLGPAGFSQARGAFETAVRDAGDRVTEVAPVAELHLTLSENQQQYLIVEEARKGDDRQVWIAAWKRAETAQSGDSAQAAALEKKLIWEQAEPILDAVFPGGIQTGGMQTGGTQGNLLLLSQARVTLYTRLNGQWEPRQSVTLFPPKPWPRDVRGRLRLNGAGFQAYLPGMACTGAVDPALTADCRPSDEPWLLESGSRAMFLAEFAASRNYFDGRITTQSGVRKSVGPFFSAAAIEEPGRQIWLLAMVDGRTQVFDSSFEPLGNTAPWGSDIAGVEARCGSGSAVLATKAGDARDPDTVRAFTVTNRAAAPLTAPLEFSGPITALWPAGANGVLAISRDAESGRYAAYLITVNCGL